MMDSQMNGPVWQSKAFHNTVVVFLALASILVALVAIGEVRTWLTSSPMANNVITVTGEGKATAIPDIATISFTVSSDGTNASQAQDAATKKNNVALELLKQKGVAEKDIKTTSYSVQPKYNYPDPCYSGYCVYREQSIVGYTVSQTTEVKVRDTAKVGDILSALGDAGVTQLYGPNFTVEDPDAVQAEARRDAIDDAEAKAKVLAKDLGVRLVRIVSYSDNNGYYPGPYYGKGGVALDSAVAPQANPAPEVSLGQNEYTVNVSITYEIR